MPRPKSGAQSDCPLADLIDVIGGRWKVLSLWHLRDGTKRFTELKRLMPGVTQKMLTQQLRQLETDGLVRREIYPQVPPKVEYSLTPAGVELGGLLLTLSGWAKDHMPMLRAAGAEKATAER
ncbi:transcriptional regulator, HxlR family [Singulisphaera sp. GP187]|uniref:winged helix-turn-helix transcriptional regulator n=1 Tax=Singulisphaera sp. GP187 TaxID=1882752 RepID=UPI000928A9BD|nr:winged helix-turn-helix transcriptional regulator [Singulisphaera sp. GP187]SIO29655.1 transcriptional regulator, HxlR family [Singulisphaera sp. GP187]